ncbi:hypothetical protein A2U01_0032172 [Trifolium medium]|uniref:Uncharacterized protein n=1 Tax=Trifolium medium TaxID=97028 RepID=A0A392PG50_9FABA|nr:hypothetical protein [Trifolium medium]
MSYICAVCTREAMRVIHVPAK